MSGWRSLTAAKAAGRVEPHVEDVGLLAERGPAAGLALQARGSEALQRRRVPDPGAFLLHRVGDPLHQLGAHHRLAAAVAEEHRDGHAPRSLPADAPVRPVLHHPADARAAPVGHPAPPSVVDLRQRLPAQRGVQARRRIERPIHGDEPLRRGAEDDRVVAAPAVRVAVLDRVRRTVEQHAQLDQELDDPRIGVEDLHPAQLRPAAPSRRSGRRPAPGCRCRGRTAGRPRSPPAPWPGAVCTRPVPCSSVTCSPRTTTPCRVDEGVAVGEALQVLAGGVAEDAPGLDQRRGGDLAARRGQRLHRQLVGSDLPEDPRAGGPWRPPPPAARGRRRRTPSPGCTAIARLAGSVHGVVVQMTRSTALPCRAGKASASDSAPALGRAGPRSPARSRKAT